MKTAKISSIRGIQPAGTSSEPDLQAAAARRPGKQEERQPNLMIRLPFFIE